MTSSFAGNRNSFLSQDYTIPPLGPERNMRLRQYFNDFAASINTRDIGLYVTEETICGQLWLPTSNAALTSGASTNLG